MSSEPFLIATPCDMLAKAERDLVRLKEHMNADNIFNFFVTAYHVMDYVKALGTVSQPVIDTMYVDADFDMCRFICNRGKHLQVTKNAKTVNTHHSGGSGLGFGAIGEGPIGSVGEWRLICDGTEVKPIELAERVVAKWQTFFATNGIS